MPSLRKGRQWHGNRFAKPPRSEMANARSTRALSAKFGFQVRYGSLRFSVKEVVLVTVPVRIRGNPPSSPA